LLFSSHFRLFPLFISGGSLYIKCFWEVPFFGDEEVGHGNDKSIGSTKVFFEFWSGDFFGGAGNKKSFKEIGTFASNGIFGCFDDFFIFMDTGGEVGGISSVPGGVAGDAYFHRQHGCFGTQKFGKTVGKVF
jgi:hypothetical protein